MAAYCVAAWAMLMLVRAHEAKKEIDYNYIEGDGCTSIIVAKGATADGSAMTSHANDCKDCDFRMAYVPARDWPEGSVRRVYDGKWGQYPRLVDPERSSTYAEGGFGVHESIVTGEIPQAPHTFALWESSYSLINEHGLAMGESTCSGQLVGTSVMDGGDAIFAIRQLMTIGLERCVTARCAVQVMGDLGARYGFYGEDPGKGGAGESVQLVDATGEAWVFHIAGGLPASEKSQGKWLGQRGALWAAQRVPEGNIAVVANNFIIREVDPEDAENFMTHPGLFDLAQEAGLWGGSGPFDFLEIMAPDVRYFRYMAEYPPMPRYVTIRQWWVWRTACASQGLEMTDNPKLYPFSVPVDGKLTHLDVMDLFRSHYEGTEFDMTLGALAGPFGSPNRLEGGKGLALFPGQPARGTSIPRTSYTQVAQSGGGVEPVVWFGVDCASSSVFVPFFARVLLPEGGGQYDVAAFGEGSMKAFSFTDGTQSAWWAFNVVANYMDKNYQNISQQYVYPKVQSLQQEVSRRALEAVALARAGGGVKVLAEVQTELQREVTEEWWKFAGMLLVRYNDNYFNWGDEKMQAVGALGYPAFWLEMVGFDDESYYPSWFRKSDSVPMYLPEDQRQLAQFSAQMHSRQDSPLQAAAGPIASWPGASALVAAAAAAALFAAGLVVGQAMGRRAVAREALPADYLRMSC